MELRAEQAAATATQVSGELSLADIQSARRHLSPGAGGYTSRAIATP
jgi:hypothetical protein